ncbi:MAG TPA: Tma20 N-terminal domain-containing protein, partial [Candidatus Nanoarchaeia archaeon]|nr:Tma20 N-terminal domain-containing protein [Candidatus Nanoarchaeia archaeon]
MKKQLSKSDVEKINADLFQQFSVSDFFDKKDRLTLVDINHQLLIVKDDVIFFFYKDGKLVPTLKLLLQKPLLKQVIVDMGAVKFVSSG